MNVKAIATSWLAVICGLASAGCQCNVGTGPTDVAATKMPANLTATTGAARAAANPLAGRQPARSHASGMSRPGSADLKSGGVIRRHHGLAVGNRARTSSSWVRGFERAVMPMN